MTDRRAILFLSLLIVVVYADILFLGRGLYLQDITAYHIAMKWIVRDIVAHGSFPFWNRFYSAGQPLAANPAYEVFYPPQWLIWLPSFHFGFQLHIIAHFVIAALGMYLLLRGLGASVVAGVFGAAAFVLSGPYRSLSSELPLLFALSWMPLALELARRFIERPSRRSFALAAIVLAMQLIIGEPTIAMQTWAFIVAYALWRRRSPKQLAMLAGVACAAVLVAAVQLLPTLDFVRDSVRSEPFEFRVVANWSMPPVRVIELALPSVFRPTAITTMYPFRSGPFISEIYVGAFVMLLALAGFLAGARGALAAFTALCASILIAIGDHTPLLNALYSAHLFRTIRYPEKFIVSGAFALIVFGALVFDRLLAGDRRLMRTMLPVAIVWAIAAAATGQIVRAVVAIAVLLLLRNKRVAMGAAMIVLTIADLWLATQYVVPRMPREYFDAPPLAKTIPPGTRIFPEAYWQLFDNEPDALRWVAHRSQETYWWLARNGMNSDVPARWGFELALQDDIDRTVLKTTDAFREAMKRSRLTHSEEPFLKMAGVGAKLTYRSPVEAVNGDTSPVTAVALNYPKFVFEPPGGEIVRASEGANTIDLDVRAAGDAPLVLSITAHRYWSATLDGAPAALTPANYTYQAIRVPAGTHHIAMRYRNPWVWPGAAISLVALIVLGAGMTRRASERA